MSRPKSRLKKKAGPKLSPGKTSWETVTDQIARYLRNEVNSQRLKPGDKLPTIRTLAQIFRASRAPAEHAVKELVKEGLLESRVGSGTLVREGIFWKKKLPLQVAGFSHLYANKTLKTLFPKFLREMGQEIHLIEAPSPSNLTGLVNGADAPSVVFGSEGDLVNLRNSGSDFVTWNKIFEKMGTPVSRLDPRLLRLVNGDREEIWSLPIYFSPSALLYSPDLSKSFRSPAASGWDLFLQGSKEFMRATTDHDIPPYAFDANPLTLYLQILLHQSNAIIREKKGYRLDQVKGENVFALATELIHQLSPPSTPTAEKHDFQTVEVDRDLYFLSGRIHSLIRTTIAHGMIKEKNGGKDFWEARDLPNFGRETRRVTIGCLALTRDGAKDERVKDLIAFLLNEETQTALAAGCHSYPSLAEKNFFFSARPDSSRIHGPLESGEQPPGSLGGLFIHLPQGRVIASLLQIFDKVQNRFITPKVAAEEFDTFLSKWDASGEPFTWMTGPSLI